MNTDVLIIGAGPSGLTTALETASKGLKVSIVDETSALGGQLRYQTRSLHHAPKGFKTRHAQTITEELVEQLKRHDIDYFMNHTAIGRYENGSVGVANGEGVQAIRAKKVVVATGATEQPVLFPGWTQPGVMTSGAAQILVEKEQVIPGKDALVVGSSEFSLDVALLLESFGVNIHAIIEAKSRIQSTNTEQLNRVSHIQQFTSSSISKVDHDQEWVKKAVITNGHQMNEFVVDLICGEGGLSPSLETSTILDCETGYSNKLGGWVPYYGPNFETTQKSVFVAGDAAGVSTLEANLITGRIAGIGVRISLGALSRDEGKQSLMDLWQQLYEHEVSLNSDLFKARAEHINRSPQRHDNLERLDALLLEGRH